jgi:hypothetical protein
LQAEYQKQVVSVKLRTLVFQPLALGF